MVPKLYLVLSLLTITKLSSSNGVEILNVIEPEMEDVQEALNILNQKIETLEFRFNKSESNKNDVVPVPKYDESLPKSCQEIQEQGNTENGIYTIQPKFSQEPFSVLCNMETHGGGWTNFLNRFNGLQDFYLGWDDYKNGFGNLSAEFWLGLEKLHLLTGYEVNELLIELVDYKSVDKYAIYHTFVIGNERDGYPLEALSGYSGTAGNGMTLELGMKFTTKDKDQDTWAEGNCADWSWGAWWYKACKQAQLTGKYMAETYNPRDIWKAIYWTPFAKDSHTMKEARMMVRPHRPVKPNPAL